MPVVIVFVVAAVAIVGGILRADLAEVAPDTGFDEEQTFLGEEQVEGALTSSSDTWYEAERAQALAAELKDRGYQVTIADPRKAPRNLLGPAETGDDGHLPVRVRLIISVETDREAS